MSDPMLDPAALEALKDAVQQGGEPRSLILHVRRERSEFQDRLRDVARQVSESTGGAVGLEERIVDEPLGEGAEAPAGGATHPPAAPALTVRVGPRDVVHYLALPEGPEEAPFLETLAAGAGMGAPSDLASRLSDLEQPTEILVFIAAACPNCPLGVRAANALALAGARVTVSVVDGFRFGELASRFQVKSVPTTVVNGGLTLIGVTTPEELARRIQQLRGPEGERAVFASLVEAGRFSDAAAHLLEGQGMETFAELWNRSALESRIGLTIVAREALDLDAAALDALAPLLLAGLESDDAARRGDTADLLGSIGHAAARGALEALLDDPHPDVAEAAADALEALGARGGGD